MGGKGNDDTVSFSSGPPFIHSILQKLILSQFRMLMVEPYDGSIDLLDHLESYKALMLLQDATDALLYLAFLATLKKIV